jgi:hypothetical protein
LDAFFYQETGEKMRLGRTSTAKRAFVPRRLQQRLKDCWRLNP